MYHRKLIRTHHYPNGVTIRAAVLPFIGDLMAIRKVLGFAGICLTISALFVIFIIQIWIA
jgi:hypothetical protein